MFFKNSRGFGFSHGFPALLALALVCLACRPAAVSAAGVAVSTAADMAVSTAADMAVSASGGMACPVCGMSVTDSSPFRFAWRGSQTTFLCSDGCRAAFTAKTPAYLEGTLPKGMYGVLRLCLCFCFAFFFVLWFGLFVVSCADWCVTHFLKKLHREKPTKKKKKIKKC
jgi:YHS domain-containing protein